MTAIDSTTDDYPNYKDVAIEFNDEDSSYSETNSS